MGKFFSAIGSKLRFSFILSAFVLFGYGHSYAAYTEECIIADDMGSAFKVIVPANPAGLKYDIPYEQGAVSQVAEWTDSGVFTNGDIEGFYFVIEGYWTPWYGNFVNKKDIWGKDYLLMAERNKYCPLKTINPESPVIGRKGEFDYINSAYEVSYDSGSGTHTKLFLDPHIQEACWLTGGEGLYIAFFGKSGMELPDIATHVKSVRIVCDKEHNTDKNGDGFISVDECYKVGDPLRKNLAYYETYRSEYISGWAQCDRQFFHGEDASKRIGINDCYEDIKTSEGSVIRYDRTKFVYKVPHLYKDSDAHKVGKNERIKFIIYDRYYRDNVGQYIITMYKGVSDMKDPGLIEKILRDLEELFVGTRNEYGIRDTGILSQFYGYIIKDTMFGWVARFAVILYMMFLGLNFAMGSLEYKTKELMGILLKLTFVLAFTTVTSWDVYDRFVVSFFLDGFSSIIVMIANITQTMFGTDTSITSSAGGLSGKFAFIDTLITFLFSNSITRKIQGLFFGVWFGFIVIPIFYLLVVYYIFQLVNAIFPYIIMFIQAVLALAVGPIFICFYLFKSTEHMFKNWLAFVGARFANMAFLFLFLFSFASIIRQQFVEVLYFKVCKVPILEALTDGASGVTQNVLSFFSLGIKVWDAVWTDEYPKPGFIGFCINLLFIYVLIYLFGIIMKKVPNIIDSMISIGGESGGGLKRGTSIFGGRAGWTFTEAFDKSIRMKNSQGKDIGIYSRVKGGIGNLVKKGSGAVGSGAWKHTGGAIGKAFSNRSAGNEYINMAKEHGMRGLDAANAASGNYRDYLKSTQKYTVPEMEKMLSDFKAKSEKEFVSDPINREAGRIARELEGSGLSPAATERVFRDRMRSFIGEEFRDTNTSRYDRFIDGSQIMKSSKIAAGSGTNSSDSSVLRRERELMQQYLRKTREDAARAEKEGASRMATEQENRQRREIEEARTRAEAENARLMQSEYSALAAEQTRARMDLMNRGLEAQQRLMRENAQAELKRLGELRVREEERDLLNAHRANLEKFINGERVSYDSLVQASDVFGGHEQNLLRKVSGLEADEESARKITEASERMAELEKEAKEQNVNLVLPGIDSDTFGVQGLTKEFELAGIGEKFGLEGCRPGRNDSGVCSRRW